jgi:arsenite-transporting ATPase
MRIVLYTGKGGVGKTCVSAAAALAAARLGHRTVILSSDRAHSLGDCFDRRLGPNPVEVAPNLEALEVDVGSEVTEHWGEIQGYFRALMTSQGVDGIVAEEIALIPGLEELCTLLRLQDLWKHGEYDALIVDCAPTGATLRLLSLPEAFGWYMRRLFHIERAAVKALRPTVGKLISTPIFPADGLYAELEEGYVRLEEIAALLADPQHTGVRLVTIPERMAVEETKRAFTEFSLYGLCVEQVIVNRVLPEEVTDPYLSATKQMQEHWIEAIQADFHPTSITQARLLPREVVGLNALSEFAEELFGGRDPMEPLRTEPPITIEETDGVCRMTVELQFATRDDVELIQHADELVIEIGSSRRNILLPHSLARMKARRAQVTDGALVITFEHPEGNARVPEEPEA